MDFLTTIAEALFNWVLDPDALDYQLIINCDVLPWILILLVIIAAATSTSFYYGLAKDASKATKKNYVVVFLLGLLVLWLANLVIVPTIVDDWSYAFGMNNILLCLVDSVYYAVLYEIISIFIKDKSNAKHIHLLNCFS